MKDENSFPKPAIVIFFIGLTLLSFFLIIISFLKKDFWQDELYALNHFVFVPWKTIATDYHSTNNHIAFDLTLKAWTKIVGIENSCQSLEHPYLIRIVPLLFTLFGLIYFYSRTKKYYGKNFSLIAISVLCSTIVFADFAVQLRGYSLSLLLTLVQFFSFLKIIKDEKKSIAELAILFLATTINLFCLPTSIYFSITLLLVSIVSLISNTAARFFFNRNVLKATSLKILLVLLLAVVPLLFYYSWLLNQQLSNQLVNSFHLFNPKNLLQALAVFFHFTDYRVYFFVLVAIYGVRRIKQWRLYSTINFPLFCFFIPFILYFVHGPVIVQRIFVPLIPIFVLLVTAAATEIFSSLKNTRWVYWLLGANLLCLVFGYVQLVYHSKSDNRLSQHSQDLVNHYYLVNFNPRQTVMKAKELQTQSGGRVYVLDDYGETGLKYYLDCYSLRYQEYSAMTLTKNDIIITNNKTRMEVELLESKAPYLKQLDPDLQYQIYQLK